MSLCRWKPGLGRHWQTVSSTCTSQGKAGLHYQIDRYWVLHTRYQASLPRIYEEAFAIPRLDAGQIWGARCCGTYPYMHR